MSLTIPHGKIEIIPLCETLKGEMVLVVEGAKEIEKQDEDVDIIAEIEKRLSQGASPKDAIKDVAKTFQLKKNEVYDLYLKHKA